LAAIDQFDSLQRLFGNVHISQATLAELEAGGRAWPGAAEVRASSWIIQHTVEEKVLVEALRLDLDRGEAEAIALAIELQADVVLLDERPGRLAAQHLGLKVMGVVGLLIRAKQVGLIVQLRPLLESLRHDAGFYIDRALFEYALTVVDES
jgi:predicted nucleic acid-binding protein